MIGRLAERPTFRQVSDSAYFIRVKRLLRKGELSAVAYTIHVTGYLCGEMLAGAVRSVDQGVAVNPNFVELDR